MNPNQPFLIEGPAVVSFSGGKTSGYMLWRILQAHGGKLPDNVKIIFSNTGKEREETLRFVRDCAEHWGVDIVWVERQPGPHGHRYRVVDFATASRKGEPFEQLITEKQYLPNVVTRFCTIELKIRVIRDYCTKVLGWDHWINIVGLRVDEPGRWVNKVLAAREVERWTSVFPLVYADVDKPEVLAFWEAQPFTLELESHEGNCDLCFLKSKRALVSVMMAHPLSPEWWLAQEARTGATFNKRKSVQAFVDEARQITDLLALSDERVADCLCTD